jgi:hypothetical protein
LRSIDSVLRDKGWVKSVQPRRAGAILLSQNAYTRTANTSSGAHFVGALGNTSSWYAARVSVEG